jgi:hypothetical protein
MPTCFTSVERAQLMLEILAQSDGQTYALPLKLIRRLSRTNIVLDKDGAVDVIASLPIEHAKLLSELRNHLGAMQVGQTDPSVHFSIEQLLKNLPPEA